MFERFTPRAREVVRLAQAEAHGMKHEYIGTEHILLGLLRERDGLAARILVELGVSLGAARIQVRKIKGLGKVEKSGELPFTPRAKKALELALREALSLGHGYIGTEHILLGLVRENEGAAMRVLKVGGLDASIIRSAVIKKLSGNRPEPEPPASETSIWMSREMNKLAGETVGLIVAMLIAPVAIAMRAKKIVASDYEITTANVRRSLVIIAWISYVVGRNFRAGSNASQRFADAVEEFSKIASEKSR